MRKRLYEVWSTYLNPEFSFFLDLPRDTKQMSKDYFRSQLQKLISLLETHFHCRITNEALYESIGIFNESRKLMQGLYHLRKTGLPGISGSDILDIIKACTVGLKKEFNENLKTLLEAIGSQKEEKKLKKHKILICGSYFDQKNIIDTIEKFGACVICEDISNGIKYFEGGICLDEEPVKAIADYYLEKNTCARVIDSNRRLNHLLELIEEYEAESVIYFSLKFCDTNLLDFPFIRDRLMERGIPVLFIEGERHMTNIENVKTRIMTFIEARMY
jgi:benzoyl-CoA reductase/2-hydroxyglutaryl-CoA dehydratase subunit BcrC/BadD/HgdB